MSRLLVLASPFRLAAAGLTAVGVWLLAGPARLALDDATASVILDTLTGTSVLAIAVIALRRARATPSPTASALLAGSAMLGAVAGLHTASLLILGHAPHWSFALAPARVAGSGCLAAIAVGGWGVPRATPRGTLAGAVGVAVGLTALATIGAGRWPGGLQAADPVLGVAAATLLLGGGLALGTRAGRRADRTLALLASAFVLLAVARLSRVLGGLEPETVSLPELLRLGASGLVLAAIVQEILLFAEARATAALRRDRHRVARELHDGLAQELSYIVSHSRRLARRSPDVRALEQLAAAGEQALTDARRAVYRLQGSTEQALSAAVTEEAFRITDRAGLALEVTVETDAVVPAEVAETIVCIVKEAVNNAARHGGATTISVDLSLRDDDVVVRIADDGAGFDTSTPVRRRSVGLRSMAARAQAVGGELSLVSGDGRGTVVEAAFR